jgi:hypothetical protein
LEHSRAGEGHEQDEQEGDDSDGADGCAGNLEETLVQDVVYRDVHLGFLSY